MPLKQELGGKDSHKSTPKPLQQHSQTPKVMEITVASIAKKRPGITETSMLCVDCAWSHEPHSTTLWHGTDSLCEGVSAPEE